jgi:5-methylcytosine-specific restriction protein B
MAHDDPLYGAARRVIDAGLAADDSILTPGVPIWTSSTADDLYHRFVEAPDTGSDSFITKLGGQLKGAPRATVQLAAELLYLHLLAPIDIGWSAKRALLANCLALSPEPPITVPDDLEAALDGGFARVGTAYLTQRDRQLAFLVRFVQAWKNLPADQQTTALTDPWAFREVVDSVPVGSAYSQRNALLHLAYPDSFESIVSRSHKSAILTAFADEIPAPTGDEDRDLLALRQSLEEHKGGEINFYDEDLGPRWLSTPSAAPAGPRLRGWLVRGANVQGQNLVPTWLAHGYCSMAYSQLPEVPPGLTRAQLDEVIAKAVPDFSVRQRAIRVGVLDRFLNLMQPGDLVATVDGPRLYVGTVTGPPSWQETPEGVSSRRRSVDWLRPDPPLRRDQLSDAARDKLQGQMTVSDLGLGALEFARLAGLDEDPATAMAADVASMDVAGPSVELPDATAELAKRLFVDLSWLNETIDLLREKKQIVLYGPPGTGKTYLGLELALYLAEQTGGEYRLVQFHPSYAYEDFFEGFRPQEGVAAGTIAFALEPGPFKLLAEEALDNPGHAYVLVIDEINRANLAKVFGELYFLLEYRDRAVTLQYSPTQEFRLPVNVFLIGTMNTADRSIALVDAAMRRRFAWQGLFPGEPPVADMLRRWLEEHHLPLDRADLLDTLNERMADRDGAIGPSYLMTQSVASEDGLQRVWKHQILPLLQERHVGEGLNVTATYGLKALRSKTPTTVPLAITPETPSEEQGEPLT